VLQINKKFKEAVSKLCQPEPAFRRQACRRPTHFDCQYWSTWACLFGRQACRRSPNSIWQSNWL